jgi:hypothetical protein
MVWRLVGINKSGGCKVIVLIIVAMRLMIEMNNVELQQINVESNLFSANLRACICIAHLVSGFGLGLAYAPFFSISTSR